MTPAESFFAARDAAVHGGVDRAALAAHGVDPDAVIDFSSNQAPLGISPAAREAAGRAVLDAYPDRDAATLAAALARRHNVAASQIVVGNGSTELIRLIAQLALREGDLALSLAPSFGEYQLGTELAHGCFAEHSLTPPPLSLPTGSASSPGPAQAVATGFLDDHAAFATALASHHPRLCWICSPNNPTGAAVAARHIATLVEAHLDTLFVLDEAYCDLLDAPQWTPALLARGNLIILRSMTKAWGLAGLRLGYVIADEKLANPLRTAKPPWNVNACAQAAGLAALADDSWYRRSIDLLRSGRAELVAGLTAQGWEVLPSAAGFFLIRVGDAAAAREHLLARGCLVRDCTSFGLPAHVRVSPRLAEQNRLLLDAFTELAPPR